MTDDISSVSGSRVVRSKQLPNSSGRVYPGSTSAHIVESLLVLLIARAGKLMQAPAVRSPRSSSRSAATSASSGSSGLRLC